MIRSEFLAGAGGGVTVAQFGSPVLQTTRVAVVAPSTGPSAALGKQLIAGVRAAVDELNLNKPPWQRGMLYTTFDDHDDASDALVQASFATGTGDVLAVIGHLTAAPTLAALRTYAAASMPLVVPTVTDDRLTASGYTNVFRLPCKDSDEGALGALYAIAAGSKAPVVLAQSGLYGATVAAGFVRGAGVLHVNARSVQLPDTELDAAGAANAALADAPDLVYLAGTVAKLGPVLDVLHAKGYAGRLMGSQGFFDPATATTYAKPANGIVVSTNVPYYPLAPTAQRDVNDYQAQYGQLTPITAYGYAAVQLVAAAIQRSGALNRLTVMHAIATGSNIDTITGSYSFGPFGDVLVPNCYFYAMRDGKFAYDRQGHPGGFMLK